MMGVRRLRAGAQSRPQRKRNEWLVNDHPNTGLEGFDGLLAICFYGGIVVANKEKLNSMAKNLSKEPPSSPRAILGGHVILQRCLDKCRSFLARTNGDYNFWPCSLCAELESFTGIDHDDFSVFVATGANDDEVAEWVNAHSKVKDKSEIIRWNNKMRDMRISEMDIESQKFLENYILEYLPKHRPVYVWFDVFDLEEERL